MIKHGVVWKPKDPSQREATEGTFKSALDVHQTDPLHLAAKAVVGTQVAGRRAVDWEA